MRGRHTLLASNRKSKIGKVAAINTKQSRIFFGPKKIAISIGHHNECGIWLVWNSTSMTNKIQVQFEGDSPSFILLNWQSIVGLLLGFKNIHVIHYPQEVLHEQIYNMLETQNKEPIPAFHLVIPQRITNIKRTASTKAYSVQCHSEDTTTQMIHLLLTHGFFRKTPNLIFVPI